MFSASDAERLESFMKLSQLAGARPDYVQGGGGNTSVKLSGGRMAIKASGYCLRDIRKDGGYVMLDVDALSRFYRENSPLGFVDVEAAGAQCTRDHILAIEGMPNLRPSVEAGFHSLLDTYVLHTHSVYANLVACSTDGRDLAVSAFSDAPYCWGWVDYQDPGANLAFSIRDELDRVAAATGETPAVILMQNHGIIVHAGDAQKCLAIHADANARLAAQFGLQEGSFPEVSVRELAGGIYISDTPYLKERLQACAYTQDQLLNEPLYPDQMVFLNNTYFQDREGISEGQAVSSTRTGELLLYMSKRKAMTIAETLTAVFFIMENIKKSGQTVLSMGDAARSFISNWESEKYRKSIEDKK